MALLHEPPQHLLRVIAFLNLLDVTTLLQTSRLWNLVTTDNEQIAYNQPTRSYDWIYALRSLEDFKVAWKNQSLLVV
jgi:hypothetical protein